MTQKVEFAGIRYNTLISLTKKAFDALPCDAMFFMTEKLQCLCHWMNEKKMTGCLFENNIFDS